LFGEVSEDFRAYGIGNTHRHLNEMRATLEAWSSGASPDLVFTPHLLPVARGILSTIVVPLAEPLADPLEPWRETYDDEPFIEITPDTPTLRDVRHRNVVRISATPLAGTRSAALLVTSAIDNLMKGAAGQAVQNANLMLGLDETAGLPTGRASSRWAAARRGIPRWPRRSRRGGHATAVEWFSFTAAVTR
jgi:N-acetyl-gamma-glutamyl-phosphate reductase